MVGASQAIASPCSTSESQNAIQRAKKERDFILANFKENDVSSAVERFQSALNKCEIPLSSFGIGSGALDYWKTQGYEAVYNKAKERLEYLSQFKSDAQAAEDVRTYSKKLGYSPQETQKYLDKLVTSGAANLNKEKKDCSPSVDLRGPRLGVVRDQDSIAWCYAVVAADMLSYKLGKKISAADIAVANNDTWKNAILKKFGKSEASIELGVAESAISRTKDKGWCLEEKMSSEGDSNWNLKSLIVQIEELKRKLPSGLSGNSDCRSALRLFGGLNLKELSDVLAKSSQSSLIPALADKACQPRLKDDSISVTSDSIFFSEDKSPLFKMVNDQLNKKNVTGIDYEAAVLYDHDYTKVIGLHSGIIVGRRYNSQTNECEYLIRNSYGRGCSSYDSSYQCDEGNIWIPKPSLFRSMRRAEFIN